MRRLGRALLLGALLAGVLGLARPARAQIVHVVKKGDTLPRLARTYYGASSKAPYLAGVNQIPLTGKLKPGQRLKIAVVWSYTVRRGDRLSGIARKILGDERRYPYLARFNDIEEVGRLSAGTRLMIPIEIRHRAVRGENLGVLAKRYYRNTRKASLLRDYNFIGKKGFSTGDVVTVPIFDKSARLSEVKRRMKAAAAAAKPKPAPKKARPRPEKKPAKASPEVAGAAPPSAPEAEAEVEPAKPQVNLAKIDGGLVRSERALRRGAYERAVTALEPLLEVVPDEDLLRQRRMRITLATALIALGRRGEATEHLQTLIELDPDTTFDPVTTSPKVMQAFQRAQEAWAEGSGEPGAGSD